MPLTRYHIRSEYGLADTELYRAADRDDTEALLEGVAMAGLVGFLRQLGDLAEFSAEIFHNLHEEVMATAARGHGLMNRLQQLEAEIPLIEKAFFSKGSHSPFLCNTGVDWHPNIRTEQNLITRGELPRFVMDSYEECRGPPRLFLLDKFDIVGAGACLKRYSDPSCFRLGFTSSEATKVEDKMEKKAHKVKKKALHWRKGETPEIFPKSHSKLHQLLLEERSQTENKVSMHHVKLKRRQSNGSLFDSTTGKSYMERFLASHSSEREVVCESLVSPTCLKMEYSNSSNLVPDIHEICAWSPTSKLVQRDNIPVPSPSMQMFLESSVDEGEEFVEEGVLKKLPESTSDIELENIASSYKVKDQNEVVNGGSKIEACANGYCSDSVASEIKNYMDALAMKESKMGTNFEIKVKDERGFIIEMKGVDFNANEEQQEPQASCSDTHSIESSVGSDEGNNSFGNERFSLYFDTLSNLVENVPSDCAAAAKMHPSTKICPAEKFEMIAIKITENGNAFRTRSPEYVVSNCICNEESEVPSYTSEFREVTCNSHVTDSTFSPSHLCPGADLIKVQLSGFDSTEFSYGFMEAKIKRSLSNVEDGKILGEDLPCKTNVSDIPSQLRDDLLFVGSFKSQPVEMLDGGNHDVSSDALIHQRNILDLVHEKNENEDALEEMLGEDAEDSSTENMINGRFDSPHSVTLHTEAELHFLTGEDIEAHSVSTSQAECLPDSPTLGDPDDLRAHGTVVEIENVISIGEKSEHLISMVDHPETGQFVEQKSPETDEIQPLELNSAAAGAEMVYNNMVVSSNTPNCEVKEWPSREGVHLNSYRTERNSDVPLDFPSGFVASATPKPVSAMQAHSELASLVTGSIDATAYDEYAILGHMPIGYASKDHIRLHDCISSNGDSNQDKLEITEASCPMPIIVSDALKEAEIQTAIAPTDYNFQLCNLESNNHSDSRLHNDVHDASLVEYTQNHLHLSNGTMIISSLKGSHQQSESEEDAISPSSHLVSKVGAPEGQFLELEADQLNGGSLHEVAESPIFSYRQSEQTEAPNHTFNAPSKSSLMDPLSQPLESISFKFDNFGSSESSSRSTFSSFGQLSQASHQPLLDPPHIPDLNFLLPDHNYLQDGMEEMPPLPPLPPKQWRIGKLQHRSQTSEGETVELGFSPLSPATTDEKSHRCFQKLDELSQPLNQFLPPCTTDDEKPLHGSQMLRREMMQHSLNPFPLLVPEVRNGKIQEDFPTLEGKIAQPLNQFLPLTVVEDEELHHGSLSLGEANLQPRFNLLSPTPTVEVVDIQHASMENTLERIAPLPNRIVGNPRPNSLTLQGVIIPTLNSSKSLQIVDSEMLQHDSPTSETEIAWKSNSTAVIATVEHGKPNGSLKAKIARPRDPLIEAVSSHDKSMLRKVIERVRPQIELKEDERDSLLEQIRTKSFNLKPPVVTRPSTVGPKTNLKVAAILEKANAIRQALAGSDEDDDGESWNDT